MPSSLHEVTKPKEYENILNELDLENFDPKTGSAFEIRLTIVQLERFDEALNEIKNSISRDMRAIKLKYLNSNKKKSSFIKTKASSRRKSLVKKRDKELEPYKKMIYIIDNYIQQIEEIKDYLDNLSDY